MSQPNTLLTLINIQAQDPGLWFSAETITEDYLQRALRALHGAVEARSQVLSDNEIDALIEPLLRAAGSSLKYYSLHKAREEMRIAMRAAIAKGAA